MIALENETQDQARDAVVLALGALRSREAIPALARLIRTAETDGDTRRCAVESLGRIVGRRFDRQTDPEAAAVNWLEKHQA